MTVQQERRIERLTEQVEAWKSIVRTYQTETDKKLLDDLAETMIRLRNVERDLETSRNHLDDAYAGIGRVHGLHYREDDVCGYCFGITTEPAAYSWPCPTIRAVDGGRR